MNTKLISLASVILVIAGATAIFSSSESDAATAPVDISAYTQSGQNILELTALENDLKINNIIVNKGNCDAKLVYSQIQRIKNKPRPRFPVTLQYGQTTKAWTLARGCNLREVTVETSQGDWTWNW